MRFIVIDEVYRVTYCFIGGRRTLRGTTENDDDDDVFFLEGRRRIGALPLEPAPPALEIVGREHTYVCMDVCMDVWMHACMYMCRGLEIAHPCSVCVHVCMYA